MNDDIKAFTDFVRDLLHIDAGFHISRIERTLPPNPSYVSILNINYLTMKPYINVIEEIAPQAMIVHDKFHIGVGGGCECLII